MPSLSNRLTWRVPSSPPIIFHERRIQCRPPSPVDSRRFPAYSEKAESAPRFALGAPFVNADWNGQQTAATTGRMLSIGFEGLYHGAGWSDGYLLYATYDFATGSEYDIFATKEDRDAVLRGTIPDMIEVNGIKGFVRFAPGLGMGLQNVYKEYVFPFDTYYVAVVYALGAYDPENVDVVIQRAKAGECPVTHVLGLQAMDFLAQSIQFQSWSQP